MLEKCGKVEIMGLLQLLRECKSRFDDKKRRSFQGPDQLYTYEHVKSVISQNEEVASTVLKNSTSQ